MRPFAVFVAAMLLGCHGQSSSPTAPPLNTAALTGNVSNATTSVPIERAEVSVTQTGQTIVTLTTSNGNFSIFTGLLPGQVQVTAKATGFDTFTATTTLVTGSNRYDVRLRPSS